MPLVRVEVKNVYGLGMPELYTNTYTNGEDEDEDEDEDEEDPKALLQGVSVAGLVGILRQLGDLSQFAAEVFQGIQEQVLITSSRSEKLGERLYNMETALPLLEKAILSQRSHLHFAYTSDRSYMTGSQWHTRLRTEQNHFINSDLPLCITDSYEGCHDPPRLHKLDKYDHLFVFDYNHVVPKASHSSFSDMISMAEVLASRDTRIQLISEEFQLALVEHNFKVYKEKTRLKEASLNYVLLNLCDEQKKRSLARHRDMTHDARVFMHDDGMDLPSRNDTRSTSHCLDVSTIHVSSKSGTEPKEPNMEDHLTSFDSRNGSGFIECIFHPRYSTQSEENETKETSSDSIEQQNAFLDLAPFHENNGDLDEIVEYSSNSQEGSASRWSFGTWDEKMEIVESTLMLCTEDELDARESEELSTRVDLIDFDVHDDRLALSVTPKEIEDDMNYHNIGALSIIASGSETDVCCQTKRELKQYSSLNNEDVDGKLKESNLDERSMNFESHVPESTYSTTAISSKQISHESHIKAHMISNSKPDLLENSNETILPQVADTSLISLTCTDNFISEEPDTDLGSMVSNELSSSSSRLDASSEQILTRYESPEKPLSTSGPHTNPIMFWTNGGLLGLAPSKPPDFGAVGSDNLVQEENTIEDDEHVATCGNSLSHLCNAGTDGPSGKSSRIFGLRDRLLANGLQRQVSFVEDEKTETAMGKPLREGSSPSPSHPLEQMRRISFEAMDGCKLKLKFCKWHGSSVDMFELARDESDTDSDNTFCRSPYASDDGHSESNSEQWDSPARSRKDDDDDDDGFGRMGSHLDGTS
ncbi:LOW QUALITY PROTEIN: hypothetical protein OSB04_002786 [Centaurea solstitialis]|uniref:Protein SCAR n=1 Tax=Centaurea solstitialis TaxID=347529 RepID=A0AA38TTM3_9ASTR|nr:LOW QUALITY PROTEIN: hypothetical protein OSB04_002786 [Centaurea solstitialis]